MNIRSLYGPWLSLGIHIDIKHYKVELHFAWWIITLGNTRSSVHCGHCDYDMGYEVLERCPQCGANFGINPVDQTISVIQEKHQKVVGTETEMHILEIRDQILNIWGIDDE